VATALLVVPFATPLSLRRSWLPGPLTGGRIARRVGMGAYRESSTAMTGRKQVRKPGITLMKR